MSMIYSGDTVTFPDGTTQNTAPSGMGFKNRIINGAMMIDQRNAGASGTGNDNYTVDRWTYFGSQASKGTWQQNAGSVTPPAGFSNYWGFTSSSAYVVGASEQFVVQQKIEGFNFADLAFGTANASPVTVSFWVRSSLTGTFGGSLSNTAINRNYPFSYAISSANTWEYKTVSIAGDTTGTWVGATNGTAARVIFSLGMGSSFSTTPNVWNGTTNNHGVTGATSVVGTNGATFYITGVQLEKGSTATSFDYRPYGTELALCQRYYEKSYEPSVVPGTVSGPGAAWNYVLINGGGTVGQLGINMAYRVTKRTTPTIVYYSPDTGASGQVGSVTGDQPALSNYIGSNSVAVYWNTTASSNGQIRFHYTASAEL